MQCPCQKLLKGNEKGWVCWWKWVKSAVREAKRWRLPQSWCSEERCCGCLSLHSLPPYTLSLPRLLILPLSFFTCTHPHMHAHTQTLLSFPPLASSRSSPHLLFLQLHLRPPATLFRLTRWLFRRGKFGYIPYLHITYLSVYFLLTEFPSHTGHPPTSCLPFFHLPLLFQLGLFLQTTNHLPTFIISIIKEPYSQWSSEQFIFTDFTGYSRVSLPPLLTRTCTYIYDVIHNTNPKLSWTICPDKLDLIHLGSWYLITFTEEITFKSHLSI